MEYPMVAMENKSADKYDLYNVITHEIGHMWYPMIVGSNERMHMWQDEGFNTFINYFSEARRFPEKGTYEQRVAHDRREVEAYMQHNVDVPLEVQPDRIEPMLLGENAYVKTAVGLGLLRDEILGPAAFDDAFREYTRRWAFKHPSPADFYRTMENVSGGSTGFSASGSSRIRTSTSPSTPCGRSRSATSIRCRSSTETTRAAYCRCTRGSRSATARPRTSTIRPRSGARTR
jgi:aminopeptidase N